MISSDPGNSTGVWKKTIGREYRTNDEVISAVEDFFVDQDESFYATEISSSVQHWWKLSVDLQWRLVALTLEGLLSSNQLII